MNLERIYERIHDAWSNIKFNVFPTKDGLLRFEASAALEGVGDDILIATIIGDRVLAIDFIFDYINATEEAYQKINQFNELNLFYKAYIRHDGFLVINYHAPVIDEEQAAQEFNYALLGLAEESMKKSLLPITKLTFQEK